MNTVEQKFRTIDGLFIQAGNFLIRKDNSVMINTVFDDLLIAIQNVQVNEQYQYEKQKRMKQFSQMWNNAKNSTKKMNRTNYDIYTKLFQYLVETYLWLIDVKK